MSFPTTLHILASIVVHYTPTVRRMAHPLHLPLAAAAITQKCCLPDSNGKETQNKDGEEEEEEEMCREDFLLLLVGLSL